MFYDKKYKYLDIYHIGQIILLSVQTVFLNQTPTRNIIILISLNLSTNQFIKSRNFLN